MAIIRIEKNSNYSVISNEVAKRSDVSARAKGIYFYLMTLPDNWKLYKSELLNHFTEGREAINTAFKELEVQGYIVKTQTRDDKGLLTGYDYKVQESSPPESRKQENRTPESRKLLSTDVLITDKQNTNKTKGDTSFLKNFEALWKIEVNKTAKARAIKNYKTALNKTTPEVILTKWTEYQDNKAGTDKRYIRRLANWLSGEHWNDELIRDDNGDAVNWDEWDPEGLNKNHST